MFNDEENEVQSENVGNSEDDGIEINSDDDENIPRRFKFTNIGLQIFGNVQQHTYYL